MASRKNKLNLLKEKITAMQSELIAMQSQKVQLQRSLSQKKARSPSAGQSPSRSTSKNKNYKSPTFWTTNPITFSQKYSPLKQQNLSPSRKSYTALNRTMSPSLREIITTVDKSYYNCQLPQKNDSKQNSPKKHMYKGKRFEFSQFGTTGYFDRYQQSKKRTYESKRKDPILDPEAEINKGLKLVKTQSRSPDNVLTEHPESNTRLYNFPKETILVNRKGAVRYKNQSNLALCSSLGELVPIKFDQNTSPKRKKSQRKHFGRYFVDNFCSQIQFE